MLCLKGGINFMVGAMDAPERTASDPSLFETIKDGALASTSKTGAAKMARLAGRDAMIVHVEAAGLIGQTGVVEGGRNRVWILMAGTDPNSTAPSAALQRTVIDRFFASFKVTAQ